MLVFVSSCFVISRVCFLKRTSDWKPSSLLIGPIWESPPSGHTPIGPRRDHRNKRRTMRRNPIWISTVTSPRAHVELLVIEPIGIRMPSGTNSPIWEPHPSGIMIWKSSGEHQTYHLETQPISGRQSGRHRAIALVGLMRPSGPWGHRIHH